MRRSLAADDGKDLNGLNITGNARTKDKVIRPEFAVQNPTSTPGVNFENGSQTLNLNSGGLMPGEALSEAGAAPRVSYQEDPVRLSSRLGSGTVTINGGSSNSTFAGTIAGQLNLTGSNTFGGNTQDPEKYGFANEEEWRTKALPAKPFAHAPRQRPADEPGRLPQIASIPIIGSLASTDAASAKPAAGANGGPETMPKQEGPYAPQILTPQTIDNLRSFLTTQSRLPDLNLDGQPRREIVDDSKTPKQDRLYNSPDELLFGARAGGKTGTPQERLQREVNDAYLKPPVDSPTPATPPASTFNYVFTRRDGIETADTSDQKAREAKDRAEQLDSAVKERDEAKLAFNANGDAAPKPGTPPVAQRKKTAVPEVQGHPNIALVTDEAEPPLATPAPSRPAPAPTPSSVSSLAGVYSDPQSQTVTRGRSKKAKPPQAADASSSIASPSSSTAAISADAINALQFPPAGETSLPGLGLPPGDDEKDLSQLQKAAPRRRAGPPPSSGFAHGSGPRRRPHEEPKPPSPQARRR